MLVFLVFIQEIHVLKYFTPAIEHTPDMWTGSQSKVNHPFSLFHPSLYKPGLLYINSQNAYGAVSAGVLRSGAPGYFTFRRNQPPLLPLESPTLDT